MTRLIDADALKEKIWRSDVSTREKISDIIDNAPTVDTYTEDIVKMAIKAGYNDGYEMARAKFERPQGDLIKAFELLKAHCKNRECNKDCVFYRELRAGNTIEQFCGLCEIVMSDDKEVKKNERI